MITCRNCGSIDDYSTEQKSNNLVATCNTCGKYIQNIPHDKPRMYVGKYKGQAIEEIDDVGYLEWALEKMSSLNERGKIAVRQQIQKLKFLLL